MESDYTPQLRRANERARALSTLTGFEPRIGLVDDVNAAFAANQTVVAVTLGQRFQRITNFHNDHHKGRRRLRMGAFDPPISGMPLL